MISKTKEVGFAFDLDSDRMILVMNGKKKSSDITLGLGVVKAIKLGIKKFVLSLDSSIAVEKYIVNQGGKVWRSKVGEANVIQKMIENDAEAGGEGSSGGFILKKFNMCRDGLLTSGLIASMIGDETIQNDIEFFESFSQIRDKVSVESSLHDRLISEIAKVIGTKYEINQLDGIKVEIDENTWSLIRKSNTEDIIRISTESNDKQLLEKVQKEMIENEFSSNDKIEVIAFDNLLIDLANSLDAKILIRGLRVVSDFEYEFQMLGMNRQLDNNIETVFLMADAQRQSISSNFVKEIARLGGNISNFTNKFVEQKLKDKFK